MHGECYKLKKDSLSIIILLIYIITGALYFIQCRSFLLDNISELTYDEGLGLFSLMLGDINQYGNELKSTLTMLGIIAVFGFVSALVTIPIMTTISVSEEYTTRSIQLITGKGISRFMIVLSKFFGISGFILIANSFMVVMGGILTITFIDMGNIFEFIPTIIIFFIKIMLLDITFITICLFCTFMIQNAGLAMPLNFIILICLIGELSKGLLSTGILKPLITYILISIVFILGTIFRFNKIDM